MALLMGVLIVVGRTIYEQFGAVGAVAGAALMGLLDVDAMTVSVTQLVPASLRIDTGTDAILVGVAANTLTKVAIGTVVGRGQFAILIGGVSIVSAIAAVLVWLALHLVG